MTPQHLKAFTHHCLISSLNCQYALKIPLDNYFKLCIQRISLITTNKFLFFQHSCYLLKF